MSVTTAQAISLLENVLFESPGLAQANAAQWVALSQADSTYSSVGGMATAMAATPEAGIAEQVVRYYEGGLGRVPSGAEIAYYTGIAEAGLSASQIALGASGVPGTTWNQIADYFAASPEFHYLSSGANVIPLFYQNILGRIPSADETAYYQKLLDGGTSVSTLFQYFVASPEFQNKVNPLTESSLAAYGALMASAAAPSLNDPLPSVPVNAGSIASFDFSSGNIDSVTISTSKINTVFVIGPAAGETIQFVAAPGSTTELLYASDGVIHTVSVTTGASVEIPAGASAVEMTGIQSGFHFTIAHA